MTTLAFERIFECMGNTRSNRDGFRGEYPKPLNLEPDPESEQQQEDDDADLQQQPRGD